MDIRFMEQMFNMEKVSLCQSCSRVAKPASCNNCYALVCADCAYTRGCKLCMGGKTG